MILRLLPLLLFISLIITNCTQVNSEMDIAEKTNSISREYYQLKVYTFDTEDQEITTDKYLKEAFLPSLKRQEIGNVGVFKLRPNETDTTRKTYLLIPFSSMEQFLSIEENLEQDSAYLASGSSYINATHEQPPYVRIESTLMKAFKDMPNMQPSALDVPREERIYELRSYESPTETYYKKKVDMFNAGGEIALFDRLNFNAVFYADVISGAKMPNLLYMTTFPDQVTRDSLWKAFFDSPEWTELKAMEKYKHSVSHADIIFLYPTDYSDY